MSIPIKEKRLQKIKDFDIFYDTCLSVFTKLGENDKRVEVFQNEHMLCICPGSRAGGNEKRIVEIFWGARPYEFVTEGKNWKNLTETGATLFFYRNDTGDVTIFLHPAKTEFRKPIEDYIGLQQWVDPKKLNETKFIQNLWDDFVAYMEVTSLDGKPTFNQKLRIWYLRNFKNLVINKIWEPTKFSKYAERVLKTTTTVFFSGAVLIYLINFITKPSQTETDFQLKRVNKNLERLTKQIEENSVDNSHLKSISGTTDSIALTAEGILEQLRDIKKNDDKF